MPAAFFRKYTEHEQAARASLGIFRVHPRGSRRRKKVLGILKKERKVTRVLMAVLRMRRITVYQIVGHEK
jgi:hypothetical protein